MASPATTRVSAQSPVPGRTRPIIVGGLVLGAVLGFGGNFVGQGSTQDLMYAISALGLILASVLLAMDRACGGDRLAAAGFVLLALGETRLLNPTDAPGGEASFAVGVLIYVPGLVMSRCPLGRRAGPASSGRSRPARSPLIHWSTWAAERSTAAVRSPASGTHSSR